MNRQMWNKYGIRHIGILWYGCMVWSCLATVPQYGYAQANTIADKEPSVFGKFQLHSQEPYQAVHIPFVNRDGKIIVQAALAGKLVECNIDTGYNGIAWAGWLKVPFSPTGQEAMVLDAGKQIPFKSGVLSDLQLGGYELQGVLGYEADTGAEGQTTTSFLHHTAILGNAAFKQVVLTIDYQRNELILRHPDYDFSHQPRSKQDIILGFSLASSDTPSYGVPVLQATFQGEPLRLVLDTGWTGYEMGIGDNFFTHRRALRDKLTLSSHTVSINFLSGIAEVESISPVEFSIGKKRPFKVRRRAIIFSNPFPDTDAYIGYDILCAFRVTIDYPRKKILLEPYQADVKKYLDPDPSMTRLIVNGITHWIPQPVSGSSIIIKDDGSVEIKSPKSATESQP